MELGAADIREGPSSCIIGGINGVVTLDRLTHHVNILEMNGESYRLGQSKARQATLKT